MKLSLLLKVLLLIIPIDIMAQDQDSSKYVQFNFVTDQIENLTQTLDEDIDFSDLLEEYLYYHENPINLNGHEIDVLAEIYLINDVQLVNLKNYLIKYQMIYSLFELKNILI